MGHSEEVEADIFIPSPRETVTRFFEEPALASAWMEEPEALDQSRGVVNVTLVTHHHGTLVKVAPTGGRVDSASQSREERKTRWIRALARLYAAVTTART